ncbi:hypothetical protein [Enemella sp. A6]|uniref:hypothetical protein n=1 Tax=Enemella sp. A6 TaxID=3440152 RepID=UPI003EBB546E
MTPNPKPSRWMGLVALTLVATMGICLWLVPSIANRIGSGWEGEQLRTGTATIVECRRAFTGLFLDHVCTADIRWDAGTTEPENVLAAQSPYLVWSPTSVEGEHAVASYRRPAVTRRTQPTEVVATLDHPAGTSRMWLGVGYVLAIVLPFLAAGAVMKLGSVLGVGPQVGKRRSNRRAVAE